MRQFILGGNVAYASALTSIAAGALAVSYLKDGVPTLSKTGAEDNFKSAELILGNANKAVGNVVIPLYVNDFSFTKMTYAAGNPYTSNFTVASVVDYTDYTIVIVKKGVQFNERNKWSYSVRSGAGTPATKIASDLVTQIKANVENHGLKATVSSAKITFNGPDKFTDYEVKLVDGLAGTAISQTHTVNPIGDAVMVKDLMRKAAADKGFEYTYQEEANMLYPNYPENPLHSPDAADSGFDIYTLRFNEPREVATMSDTVNTIVQVALPSGGTGNAAFETVLKGMLRLPAAGAGA